MIHFFQGKEGTSLDGYVQMANGILFNPEDTIERVEHAYEEQLAADDNGGRRRSPANARSRTSNESAMTCRRRSVSSRSARICFLSDSKTQWIESKVDAAQYRFTHFRKVRCLIPQTHSSLTERD